MIDHRYLHHEPQGDPPGLARQKDTWEQSKELWNTYRSLRLSGEQNIVARLARERGVSRFLLNRMIARVKRQLQRELDGA